ncbi:hypothetical protein [Spiroplasma endosymbiont of Nomada rufipes]|uniref:hypothetical protein n=1 Tax=Spiroplasma endosymbiont of Nomada rufipes TaxID=3077933 RepID=UPI00376F286C
MKFLYENFLQFYLLTLTSIIQQLNASVCSSLIVDKKLFAGTITNVWELDIE